MNHHPGAQVVQEVLVGFPLLIWFRFHLKLTSPHPDRIFSGPEREFQPFKSKIDNFPETDFPSVPEIDVLTTLVFNSDYIEHHRALFERLGVEITENDIGSPMLRFDEDFDPSDSGEFEPTDAPAGSQEKIETLRKRVELGLPLWHGSDRVDYSGLTGAVRPRE